MGKKKRRPSATKPTAEPEEPIPKQEPLPPLKKGPPSPPKRPPSNPHRRPLPNPPPALQKEKSKDPPFQKEESEEEPALQNEEPEDPPVFDDEDDDGDDDGASWLPSRESISKKPLPQPPEKSAAVREWKPPGEKLKELSEVASPSPTLVESPSQAGRKLSLGPSWKQALPVEKLIGHEPPLPKTKPPPPPRRSSLLSSSLSSPPEEPSPAAPWQSSVDKPLSSRTPSATSSWKPSTYDDQTDDAPEVPPPMKEPLIFSMRTPSMVSPRSPPPEEKPEEPSTAPPPQPHKKSPVLAPRKIEITPSWKPSEPVPGASEVESPAAHLRAQLRKTVIPSEELASTASEAESPAVRWREQLRKTAVAPPRSPSPVETSKDRSTEVSQPYSKSPVLSPRKTSSVSSFKPSEEPPLTVPETDSPAPHWREQLRKTSLPPPRSPSPVRQPLEPSVELKTSAVLSPRKSSFTPSWKLPEEPPLAVHEAEHPTSPLRETFAPVLRKPSLVPLWKSSLPEEQPEEPPEEPPPRKSPVLSPRKTSFAPSWKPSDEPATEEGSPTSPSREPYVSPMRKLSTVPRRRSPSPEESPHVEPSNSSPFSRKSSAVPRRRSPSPEAPPRLEPLSTFTRKPSTLTTELPPPTRKQQSAHELHASDGESSVHSDDDDDEIKRDTGYFEEKEESPAPHVKNWKEEHIAFERSGMPLGILIMGGSDKPRYIDDGYIYVVDISPVGAARKDGRLQVGDIIVVVNGKSLLNMAAHEAAEILYAQRDKVQLTVKRADVEGNLMLEHKRKPLREQVRSVSSHYDWELGKISFERNSDPLGFEITGGKDQALQPDDHNIYVLRISAYGAAFKDKRIRVGDIITEAHGVPMEDITLGDAYMALYLSQSVNLMIKRPTLRK